MQPQTAPSQALRCALALASIFISTRTSTLGYLEHILQPADTGHRAGALPHTCLRKGWDIGHLCGPQRGHTDASALFRVMEAAMLKMLTVTTLRKA